MTKPKITITIDLKNIAGMDLKEYQLSAMEKKHLDKFIKDYCNATEKYLSKNRMKGDLDFKINYG